MYQALDAAICAVAAGTESTVAKLNCSPQLRSVVLSEHGVALAPSDVSISLPHTETKVAAYSVDWSHDGKYLLACVGDAEKTIESTAIHCWKFNNGDELNNNHLKLLSTVRQEASVARFLPQGTDNMEISPPSIDSNSFWSMKNLILYVSISEVDDTIFLYDACTGTVLAELSEQKPFGDILVLPTPVAVNHSYDESSSFIAGLVVYVYSETMVKVCKIELCRDCPESITIPCSRDQNMHMSREEREVGPSYYYRFSPLWGAELVYPVLSLRLGGSSLHSSHMNCVVSFAGEFGCASLSVKVRQSD